MQGDKDALNFSKLLKKNKKLGWYKEPFIFPKTPEISRNSNGEPAAKKPKQNASPTNFFCENCPVLQVSISQLQHKASP